MKYGRRRKYRFKRTGRYKKRGYKAKSFKRAVKSTVYKMSESKYLDFAILGNVSNFNSSSGIYVNYHDAINAIPPGSSNSSRIGSKIFVQKMNVKVEFVDSVTGPYTTTQVPEDFMARIGIFWPKDCSRFALTGNAYNYLPIRPFDHPVVNAGKLYWTKMVTLGSNEIASTTANAVTMFNYGKGVRTIWKNTSINRMITWRLSTTSESYPIFFVANPSITGSPGGINNRLTYQGTIRIWYKDL